MIFVFLQFLYFIYVCKRIDVIGFFCRTSAFSRTFVGAVGGERGGKQLMIQYKSIGKLSPKRIYRFSKLVN